MAFVVKNGSGNVVDGPYDTIGEAMTAKQAFENLAVDQQTGFEFTVTTS